MRLILAEYVAGGVRRRGTGRVGLRDRGRLDGGCATPPALRGLALGELLALKPALSVNQTGQQALTMSVGLSRPLLKFARRASPVE